MTQLGLALVRIKWRGIRYEVWMREQERWERGICVTGWNGCHWVRFENVLEASWL